MGKSKRVVMIVFGVLLSLMISFFVYALSVTYATNLDYNKLIDNNGTVLVFDKDNNLTAELNFGGENVSLNSLHDYTKNAFIAIEDKRFYSHNGIDLRGIVRATINNLKAFSYKEGASTITQQLIKNTHLSSDKTINRKLKEFKLALLIEQKYNKDQILEMYLNQIYFGNNAYGIESASKKFFNKSASDLTLNESALLAGIIKAPKYYSPFTNFKNAIERKNVVLKNMLEQNYITNDDYNNAINETLIIKANDNYESLFIKEIKNQLAELIKDDPYSLQNCKVYTEFDKEKQAILENEINKIDFDCKKISWLQWPVMLCKNTVHPHRLLNRLLYMLLQ